MTASIVIEGKISVNAVLHSKYRKVLTLFYDVAKLQRKRNTKQAKSLKQILELVNSKEIKIDAVDHDWFEKNANGKTHGGIAATVSERTYQKLPELIKSKPGIIFFLEGIEDPYNLGYTIRSLYAAGIDGIVMKQRSWLDVEAIIIKSSAGTSELMPIALVEDLETTADFFKSNNYSVACTAKDKGQSTIYNNWG
jgi:23S rRNA (guanosine2251-2'-O)-methyltransferase